MQHFLYDKDLKLTSRANSTTKFWAWADYKMINEKLYWKADEKHEYPQIAVSENDAFDVIVKEHLQLIHAGRDKTWAAVDAKYYGIQKTDVAWVCAHCKNCILNRPSKSKPLLKPIVADKTFKRLQIDLIDIQHESSGNYTWILHIKDYFSKYSMLYPLHSKHASPIAACISEFIKHLFLPQIVQCNKGKEFKGALLILL
jgi:hypothetical protein